MSIVLRKDPILEAVCEFFFDAPDWDWTVPGLVYRQIKDRFPEKAEAPHVNFSIEQRPDGVHSSAAQSLGRMQFWGPGRQSLVQIGPNHLSIHQIKSYAGWPIYKTLIEDVLRDYESAAPAGQISAMSLRYVNQMPLPQSPYKIESLVKTLPQIPDSQEQEWLSWFQQVEILRREHKAILGVRCGHLPGVTEMPQQGQRPEEPRTHILDLQFAHAVAEPIARENVSSWLEIAHGEIEKMFFDSVEADYLKIFEPEEENENTS